VFSSIDVTQSMAIIVSSASAQQETCYASQSTTAPKKNDFTFSGYNIHVAANNYTNSDSDPMYIAVYNNALWNYQITVYQPDPKDARLL
jgi:hypothetical protein